MKTEDHLGRPIVAVTGIGVVTPLGAGMDENWKALTEGRSGIHTITRFPTDHLKTTIAGTVDFLPASGKGVTALTQQLAEYAGREAVAQAGLSGEFSGPLFLASPPVELSWQDRLSLYKSGSEAEGYQRLLAVSRAHPNRKMHETAVFATIADRLADSFGTRGLPVTLSTACASGATAIQMGVEAIRRRECDRALAIGTDGSATAEGMIRFSLLSALSIHNDPPQKASKPFSKDRDGFVLSEGAGGGATSTVSSRRSSINCNARMLAGGFPLANVAVRLDGFPRQDKAGVLAAEAEGIGEDGRNVGRTFHVGHHVEVYRRVRVVVVDGRRDDAFAHGHQRECGLDRTGGR